MIDSGRVRRARVGRHEGDARSPRRRGVRPTVRRSASSRRCSRSRQTMNAQRCWFLELPERRPARRMRSRWAGSSGRSANRRTARFEAMASDGSGPVRSRFAGRRRRRCAGPVVAAPSRSRAGASPRAAHLARSAGRPSCRCRQRDLRRASAAAGVAARAGARRRDRPRVGRDGRRRVERSVQGSERGTPRPCADSPRPRTARSAGRPATTSVSTGAGAGARSRAARAAAASRSRWLGGTTASSSPWARRTGPS